MRRYPWVVYIGWFFIALVFSYLTRLVLLDLGLSNSTGQLITYLVAIVVAFTFFYMIRRYRK